MVMVFSSIAACQLKEIILIPGAEDSEAQLSPPLVCPHRPAEMSGQVTQFFVLVLVK